MAGPTSLRQRQKEQTRQLISGSASRLFAERGFDAVTVAEVARAAEVSEMTVFNHFPTKEDLFFEKMEFFEERLLEAVRARAEGVSAVDAFRRLILDSCRTLAQQERAEAIAKAAGLIGASQALQAREREIVAQYTKRLAELLAAETRAREHDVEPWGVASGLMGAHRALVSYVRRSVLAGQSGPRLAADARSQARRAFTRLERGIGEYAVKRS
jgi:AcrR family transcriptional regulator